MQQGPEQGTPIRKQRRTAMAGKKRRRDDASMSALPTSSPSRICQPLSSLWRTKGQARGSGQVGNEERKIRERAPIEQRRRVRDCTQARAWCSYLCIDARIGRYISAGRGRLISRRFAAIRERPRIPSVIAVNLPYAGIHGDNASPAYSRPSRARGVRTTKRHRRRRERGQLR